MFRTTCSRGSRNLTWKSHKSHFHPHFTVNKNQRPERKEASVVIQEQTKQRTLEEMSSCRSTAHTFLLPYPSSWGRECLALFNNHRDQYLVSLGDQSPAQTTGLGTLESSRLANIMERQRWSQGCLEHGLWDLGRGKGRGPRSGAFSTGRHSISNASAMGTLGHGQLGRISSWATGSLGTHRR